MHLQATSKLNGRPFCVLVGPTKVEFWIHQSLLGKSSKYFAAIFSGDWTESRAGEAILEDVEPLIFEAYQNFLYYRKVDSALITIAGDSVKAEYERLIRCYALGDRLADADFRDGVVDQVIAISKTPIAGYLTFPFAELTAQVYTLTPRGSPHRRLIIDQHVFHGLSTWVSEAEADVLEKHFLYDLSKGFLEQRIQPLKSKAPDRAPSTCIYHCHDAPSSCYKAN